MTNISKYQRAMLEIASGSGSHAAAIAAILDWRHTIDPSLTAAKIEDELTEAINAEAEAVRSEWMQTGHA